MLQEVYFCRDGARESRSMTFQDTVALDHVAHKLGIATGTLQLRTQAGHFSDTMPGQVWTLEELRLLCGSTAGTTAASPIAARGAPAEREREPCSAGLSLEKACYKVMSEPKAQL